jgi:anti-anti-sigma factor
MREQLLDLELERDGRIVVAVLTGEIDMSNAPSIRQRIAEFVMSDDDALVADLSPLSYIDSAGLHTFVELSAVLEERRQRLVLCVPEGSQVARVIEIVGIPRASIHRDLDAAIRAARRLRNHRLSS